LTVEEIKAELSLHCERLNVNSNGNEEGEILEEHDGLAHRLLGLMQNLLVVMTPVGDKKG
jgi:hypothetical protein